MPVHPAVIDQQLAALPQFSRWFTRKEIRALPNIINAGEEIYGMTSGYYELNTWLVVVTNHRILFLDRGWLIGLRHQEIPLAHVSNIATETGLLFGQINIASGGGDHLIDYIWKRDVPKLAAAISQAVQSFKLPVDQRSQRRERESEANDPVSQLERLGLLKAQGVITDAEFKKQKKKILGD